jgi:hypothetical protein
VKRAPLAVPLRASPSALFTDMMRPFWLTVTELMIGLAALGAGFPPILVGVRTNE